MKGAGRSRAAKYSVDLDNLIDFMSLVFYTGNFDSPTAVFMENKKANNFYAIDNRDDKSKGFTFYMHDAEHSLFDEAHNPGMGLYEDRVSIGTRQDDLRMEVSDLSRFHPQWLHFRLSANPEYRIRFADRAWKHFSRQGVFSPDSALKRLNRRIGRQILLLSLNRQGGVILKGQGLPTQKTITGSLKWRRSETGSSPCGRASWSDSLSRQDSIL